MLGSRTLVPLMLMIVLAACAPAKTGAVPTPTPPPATALPATPPPASTTPPASPDATVIAQAVAASVVALGGTSAAATAVGPRGTGEALAPRTLVAGAPPVLPAPIYLLERGQVRQVERDAVNSRQITFEPQPVLELAVPPDAGAIFYLTGDPVGAERVLVALSGAGRRDLLAGKLSSLVVSPDGQRIFVRIDDPAADPLTGSTESPSGVWATNPAGDRPKLLLADVIPDDGMVNPAPVWTYRPSAVSPDGTRVALYAFDTSGPAISGSELVIVGPKDKLVRGQTCCEEPAWSVDGKTLAAAGGGPGPDLRYGLYVNNAATGAETPVIEDVSDTVTPLVVAPRQLADGQLYAFVELAQRDGFSWDYPFHPALSRVAPDGTVKPLAPPTAFAPSEVLWRTDGSGAVLAESTAEPDANRLYWQAANGQPVKRLPFTGSALAWVPTKVSLAAGACAAFASVRYQSARERQFSAAAFDVQGRLRALGFDAGTPDGFYGDKTRTAVSAFQQRRGLPVTGEVDCATWQTMLTPQ